jgi:ACS family hexuronate transporter-like MFS transporter
MSPGSNAWKWWIAVVLFLATVLTYLDRQTLSLCGAMISEELDLSNEQYGQLVAAFRWSYAIVHVPAGFLADRVPLRVTYALAVALWSAAGAAAAFVANVRQLLFTRGLLGVGEAFNWPCATRIVANMLPPEDRGLASGIFNSGAAIGSLVAPLIITPLAIQFGWRVAFFVIGAIGTFWIVLWLAVTGRGSRAAEAINGARLGVSETSEVSKTSEVCACPSPYWGRRLARWCRDVLLHPAFWMLMLIGVATNPCWYFLNEWIPKYLHDQRGMGYLSAGLVTVPIFLGADLGNLLSGGLIKVLTLRGWSLRAARGATLTVAALLILPVGLITYVESVYLAVAMLGVAALGITSIVANYTACQQDFSFANVGIVAGILGMSCNVFSALVNPLIGRYVDYTGHYGLIFILMALLPLVSLTAVLVFDTLVTKKTLECGD